MKKTLSVVLSFLLCGTMFAGCNKERKFEEAIKDVETSTEVITTVETTEQAKTETTTEETTQTVNESEISGSYSLVDISIFDEGYVNLGEGKKINFEESLTCKLYKELAVSDSMYSNMTKSSANSSLYMEVAINENNFVMKSNINKTSSFMYIVDMVFTLYDESTMTAQRMTISQEDFNSLGIDQYKDLMDFGDINSVTTYETTIDGKNCTYEVDNASNAYFVYDENKKFVISTNSAPDTERIIIYALTTEVPADVWTQPTGYTITNLD